MTYIERDKNKTIQNFAPHYTQTEYRNAQTVYLDTNSKLDGDAVSGAEYAYSDRLRSWVGLDAYDAAWSAVKEEGVPLRSAAFVEALLRRVWNDDSIQVVHILAGVNWGNGYPYQVYGYTKEDTQS